MRRLLWSLVLVIGSLWCLGQIWWARQEARVHPAFLQHASETTSTARMDGTEPGVTDPERQARCPQG